MIELLSEAVVHAFVAALVVEALLRIWRLGDPAAALRLRLVALVLPVFTVTLFGVFAPLRREEWFVAGWGVFASQHWAALTFAGLGLDRWWTGAMAATGTALFLADAVPFVRSGRRTELLEDLAIDAGRVRARVAALSRSLRIAAPRLVLLDTSAAVLFCRGPRHPELVVSRGTIDRLDDRELDAALAHELAHVARNDLRLSWALWAVRTLLLFNPVAHVVARAIAADLERRADDGAAAATGDRLAVASALVSLFEASQGARTSREPLWGPFISRARQTAIERRCRRLLDPPTPDAPAWARTRVAATAGALAALLFFVR